LFTNGGVIREKECKFKRRLKRRYIKHALGYLSPNEKASLYLTFYGAREKIVHYPYCTYYEKDIKKANISEKERNALREKYNLPQGKLFISASIFIKRKNNYELFDAFKGRNDTLVLYGSGPLKNKYEEYLKVNNINNVIIRDFISSNELMEIMSCCDCFITLSKEDIYGHTTIEALASGIPVISSNKVVSSLSVIKTYENGYLVSSKEDVLDALDKVDYAFMSKNCIETAKQFTIEKEANVITTGLEGFII
jgi:glycosyltransferase involved in cell wall biosynthesis